LARAALLAAVFLALACGSGENKQASPTPPASPKPQDKLAPVAPGTEPAPTTPNAVCPPGDPLCDPGLKAASVVASSVKGEFRDVIQLKAPRKDATGGPAGAGSVVIFPHKAHATERLKALAEKCEALKTVNDCGTCHHMDKEKENKRRCEECHKQSADPSTKAPAAMEAFHTRCVGCHTTVQEKCGSADAKFKVATQCDDCHKAPPTSEGVTPAAP
jgi:hypothetical protein